MDNISTMTAGLRYGMMTGLVLIVLALIMYLTGLQDFSTGKQSIISQLLSYGITAIGVVLAIKFYKDSNDGMMTYGQGVVTSLITRLVMGIISAIWILMFFNFIDTGALELLTDATRTNIEKTNPNMSEQEIETAMSYATMFLAPGAMAIMVIIATPITTLIVGLIASAFMKNDQYAA
jgi:hypothetical protein